MRFDSFAYATPNPNATVFVSYTAALTSGPNMFKSNSATAPQGHTNVLGPRSRPCTRPGPKAAMESFVTWIKMQHTMNTNSVTNLDNVILVAHYGSNHDHVYLMKTIIS